MLPFQVEETAVETRPADGARPATAPVVINVKDVGIGAYNIIGAKLGDDVAYIYANSALVNTAKEALFTKLAQRNQFYLLTVYNPGASILTGEVHQIKRGFGGSDQWAKVADFEVPASTATLKCHSFPLQFPFLSDDMKIVLKNQTAIASDGGFTGAVRLEIII